MPDTSSEGVSTAEEQNDLDSAALMKKRRLENGVYTCDLCSKVFQKGSSLLRHKYEHTGKMVACNRTSHSLIANLTLSTCAELFENCKACCSRGILKLVPVLRVVIVSVS